MSNVNRLLKNSFKYGFKPFAVIPVKTCLPAGRRESSLFSMLLDTRSLLTACWDKLRGYDIITGRKEFFNSQGRPPLFDLYI